jgi:O-antigen/teichoic acid export membrane protein
VVIARLLLPDAKGRFTLVLIFSQLAALLVGLGLDQALGFVAGRSREAARRGFANAIAWTFVVGGLATLAAMLAYGLPTSIRPRGPLTTLLPNLDAAQFTYAALALPGELFFAVGLFALLGRGQVGQYNLIRFLRRLVLLLLLVATAAIARLNLNAALIINLIALGLSIAAILVAATRGGILGLRPDVGLLGEQLRFGIRSFVGSLAERLQFRVDAFLLNALIAVGATGVYSVASGLAETLWYVPNALGVVMFSRAVDPDADAAGIAAAMTRTTLMLTAIVAVPVFFLAPLLVESVYGPAFAGAAPALRALLPGIVAYSVVAILSRYIVGVGRPQVSTAVLVTGLLVNVGLNLVLIPRFGLVGAATSSSISYVVTAVLVLAAFRRLAGRSLADTLVIRRSDIDAARSTVIAMVERIRDRRRALPLFGGSERMAELVISEHDPGEEP